MASDNLHIPVQGDAALSSIHSTTGDCPLVLYIDKRVYPYLSCGIDTANWNHGADTHVRFLCHWLRPRQDGGERSIQCGAS